MQTEAAAIIIFIGITVSKASALDLGQDGRMGILIRIIGGCIIGRNADFKQLTIHFLFGNSNDSGARCPV